MPPAPLSLLSGTYRHFIEELAMILFKSKLPGDFHGFHIAVCKAQAEQETGQIQPFKVVLCFQTTDMKTNPHILASSARDVSIDAAMASLLNLLAAFLDHKKDEKLGSMLIKRTIYGDGNFSGGSVDEAFL